MAEIKQIPQYSVPEEITRFIQGGCFTLNYRDRFRVHSGMFVASNLTEAVQKGEEWCKRNDYRFVSVHPLFIDINGFHKTTRTQFYGDIDDAT